MFFFLRKKTLKSGLKYNSPRERFIRVLLVLFFGGVACLAFWANSERYIAKFNASSRILDETGTLKGAPEKRIREYIIKAEEDFGVKIHVKASKVPVLASEAPNNAIFVGVCPGLKQTVLAMPDDWRRVLGDGFVFRLRNEVLQKYAESGAWENGVSETLKAMLERFAEIVGPAA